MSRTAVSLSQRAVIVVGILLASSLSGGLAQPQPALAGVASASISSPLGPLSASSASPGEVDLVSRASTGAVLRHGWRSSEGLISEETLGGAVVGAPAAASRTSDSLSVVVRGTNNAVYVKEGRADGTWPGWQYLGGTISARPAVAADGSGRLDLLVRGTDGAVYHKLSGVPGSWSGWKKIGGSTLAGTGPAAAWTSDGRLDVVAVGTNKRIYRKIWSSSSGWSPWRDLGGTVETDPSLTATSGGAAVLAVRGTNKAGYVRTLTASTSGGWASIGGALASSPAAASMRSATRADVFALGTNGVLYRKTLLTSTWGNWQRVGAAGTTTARELMSRLVTAAEDNTGYDRTLFRHWIDADKDCQNTRHDVLQIESTVTPTLSFNGCTVVQGRWLSRFDGAVWTNPSDVDIDHHVALAEAWGSGARSWTTAQRESFANDIYGPALNAMTDNLNASKSASDVAEWLPPQDRCTYVIWWVQVKYRWALTIDTTERSALTDLLSEQCGEVVVPVPPRAK